MKCEFDYCIYNKDFLCILEETHINSSGVCDAGIMVSIPKSELGKLKERQLEEIESRQYRFPELE